MDMSIKLNASYPAVTTQAPAATAVRAKPVPQAETESAEEPQRVALEKAVTDMREFVQASQRNLDFSIDDSTGKVVVKVIATDSGEVIRQIPSEIALKLAQNLSDASSLLFDTKA
ncbi:flagellar protein FlaG [Pseudomonas fluorescens]|uniref:Flagellar biosynthesis protein FlaG n=2 Tax=Pseudomonas fluorescens group TaxID=136843 RepID=A0ABS9FA95_9PSED|nr:MULTISPECIES: flagellar protein FlaG [Pseudomonas fluorescens group]AIG05440.1 flagellar protein FlaG [Pseudomonas fluorescens]MCF4980338.1 flagellar biosynthesis protein FlaG [Pseudomonas gessardii]MCF4990195.1 flagellar biosynthesis protein FlaG [Pseudomonas gessardii]MCF5085474.1 flagellar biosynthesis protein FlaG [Pseudomonas gessardii]MCF5094075.1 flagellar biosynthesis protein FlaG [Pseudomonas gessardii]